MFSFWGKRLGKAFVSKTTRREAKATFQANSRTGRRMSQGPAQEVLPKAYVRSLDTEEKISLSFSYSSGCPPLGERCFTFNRNRDEQLERLFARLKQNLAKVIDDKKKRHKKKKQKKKGVADEVEDEVALEENLEERVPLDVQLEVNDVLVGEDTLHADAWADGAILRIGGQKYRVSLNPPTVKSLSLPKTIMAGFSVYPFADLHFADLSCSQFVWFKQRLPHEKVRRRSSEGSAGEGEEGTEPPVGYGGWIKVSEGFYYSVSAEDIGRRLKIKCIPRKENRVGPEVEFESKNPIEAGPGRCPFEERHVFTSDLTGSDSLRVISYNILADLYADSDFTRTVLFPYCPPYALEIDYRRLLLVKEITGYNGDIICLQEVDHKVYDKDLKHVMEMQGMDGIFNRKGGTVAEGLACFFRKSRFKLIDTKLSLLADALNKEPLFEETLSSIKGNNKLLERISARTSVLQCTLLEDIADPKRALLIGNTHLYFHPDADHIRLLQAYICLQKVQQYLALFKKQYGYKTISPIFCGDFNSCPEFGVYQLATTGFVGEESADWRSNSDEVVEKASVSHSLSLSSGCGTPLYTNYTLGFNGCLDYIFYDNQSFKVTEVVPFPSHEQVTHYKAIPNVVFPSDHLALICTLKWQ